MSAWICPFCGNQQATADHCSACNRNPSLPRRVCSACNRVSPSSEAACMHCKRAFGSEMSWKVPLIVLLFVAAIVISVALQMI